MSQTNQVARNQECEDKKRNCKRKTIQNQSTLIFRKEHSKRKNFCQFRCMKSRTINYSLPLIVFSCRKKLDSCKWQEPTWTLHARAIPYIQQPLTAHMNQSEASYHTNATSSSRHMALKIEHLASNILTKSVSQLLSKNKNRIYYNFMKRKIKFQLDHLLNTAFDAK